MKSGVALDVVRLVLLGALALSAACGGGNDRQGKKSKPTPPWNDFSHYAIHVFEEGGDNAGKSTWHELQFGPGGRSVAAPSAPGESDAGAPRSTKGVGAPPRQAQVTINTDEGGTVPDHPMNYSLDGLELLYRAGLECNQEHNFQYDIMHDLWRGYGGADNWYFFENKYLQGASQFTSCDDILQREQELLCVAGKLANVGSAVRPVIWDNSSPRWIIPPQATKDRFIVRDLAINVLANLGRLDQELPLNWDITQENGCAEAYAKAASDPIYTAAHVQCLYDDTDTQGSGSILNWSLQDSAGNTLKIDTNESAYGESRLRLEARTLAAAGDMLKELIDDSFEADMAGARAKLNQAEDPTRGRARYFARDPSNEDFYNSIAHLFKLLYGRLEVDSGGAAVPASPASGEPIAPYADPKCNGVAAIDLEKDAAPRGFQYRGLALPTKTQAQADATNLIAASGIVLDDATLEAGQVDPNAIQEQLQYNAALQSGITGGTGGQDFADFKLSEAGQAIAQQFKSVSDADVMFGLERSNIAYHLVTDTDQNDPMSAGASHGLTFASPGDVVSGISAVVPSGVPKQDADVDMAGTAWSMMAASACPEEASDAMFHALAGVGRTSAFQNVFTLAGTLQRRLAMIGDFADQNGLTDTEAADTARTGSAELRGWAGPGMAVLVLAPGEGKTHVAVTGLTPKDLGVEDSGDSPISSEQGELVLIVGQRWEANCAAGLRKSCPDPLPDEFTPLPGADLPYRSNPDGVPGIDGRAHALDFPAFTAGPSPTPDEAVFLVAKHSPGDPKHGRILAAFPIAAVSDVVYVAPISDYLDELTNEVLGLQHGWPGRSHPGGSTPADPQGYCIEHVPADLFVPLENELTSDADPFENSWKHYLTLAQQAADRTDELGSKLIEQGLQQDFRSEAAGEELADICGDYTALDKVKVEKGEVTGSPDDESLNECLDEPTTDVVFLTDDPYEASTYTDDQIDDKLKEAMGCNVTGAESVPALCNVNDRHLTHKGLKLADYENDTTSNDTPDCSAYADLVNSIDGGFKANAKIASEAASNPPTGSMATIVGNLRFTVLDDEFHWTASLDGNEIMDTQDPNYWPACVDTHCTGASPLGYLEFELDAALNGGMDAITNVTAATPAGAAVRDALLQRVSGIVWLMGAMTGSVPKGLFTLPVPAVNYGGNASATAPAAMVYGYGNFQPNGSGKYDLDTSSPGGNLMAIPDEQKDALEAHGPAREISDDEALAIGAAGSPHPEWVRQFYGAAGSDPAYLAVTTATRAEQFPPLTANDTGGATLGAWLRDRFKEMSSNGCLNNTASMQSLRRALRLAKYPPFPSSASQICTAPDGHSPLLIYGSGVDGVDGSVPSHALHGCMGQWVSQCTVCAGWGGTCASLDNYSFPGDEQARLSNFFWYGKSSSSWHSEKELVPVCSSTKKGAAEAIGCGASHDDEGYHQYYYSQDCVNQGTYDSLHYGFYHTARSLFPGACPPENRAHLFLNTLTPYPNGCAAGRELTRALALSCILGSQYQSLSDSDPLPPMVNPSDIAKLQSWIAHEEVKTRKVLSRIVLTNVPDRVVADFKSGVPGSGSLKGQHGQLILAYEQGIQGVAAGWKTVEGDLVSINGSIGNAAVGLKGADLKEGSALAQTAMQRIQLQAQKLKAVIGAAASAAKSLTSLSPFGALDLAGAAIDIHAADEELGVLDQLDNIAADEHANDVAGVMNQLQTSIGSEFESMQSSLDQVRASTAAVKSNGIQLEQSQNKAKYAAAKGKGQDYVTINGETVPMPVNTVLRRQFDLTRRRYKAALHYAKVLAYMARRAIEQRLGMQLDEMHDKIGPLDAPSSWADDVCRFSGVDYSRFRTGDVPDGGLSDAIFGLDPNDETKFTDPFIGDYVQKLQELVEYYNAAYPSHEGDDVAVLSLRDDLLGPQGQCSVPARNLLLFSGALDQQAPNGDEAAGWQLNVCNADPAYSDANCLMVDSGASVVDSTGQEIPPPAVSAGGGVTWLHDVDAAKLPDPDPDGGAPAAPSTEPVPPSASVYQPVELESGKAYILSWWDLARSDAGGPTATAVPYRVGIYDSDWNLLKSDTPTPYVPGSETATDGGVSDGGSTDGGAPTDGFYAKARRSLDAFTAPKSGTYYVLFGASVSGPSGGTRGSVAIADVQLEQASSTSSYQDTTASRLVLSHDCASRDPAEFRNAFRYVCEDNQCYYELKIPINIETPLINDGTSRLVGKIARGNFNYRTLSVAFNLVGTGVLDCSKVGSQSCYGSSYVEYRLDHDAYKVPILNYFFVPDYNLSFGSARIDHAKALAAERYITLPIGSADQGLLSQPEVTKPEFRGRPISGAYRLRIYDQPSLVWDKVEDVQFVLNYRYWARIDSKDKL